MGKYSNIPFKYAYEQTRVELSRNSGWHCKKMVSCFVSKSIYYNSWFGQFLFLKISIKSSTTDMFYRLESFVRGILQKRSIGLKETSIQRAYLFTYFAKKASFRSDRRKRKERKGKKTNMQAISQGWVRPTILKFHLLQEGIVTLFVGDLTHHTSL